MFKLTKQELLSGNIYKGLFKITIPLIFLNLINTLYGVVDTYFVGLIGELEVGAVSIITPISACATAFCEGLCAAGIALISRAIGKGKDDETISIANHLIILCLIIGLLSFVTIQLLGHPILSWLNTPGDIYTSSYDYLFGISFDFIFLFIISIYQAICQAHGDSKSGVILNTISAILNCLLDPLFILVFKMGTFGAALATVLSKAIVVPYAFYKLTKEKTISYQNFQIDLKVLKQITLVAIPSSIGYFLSSFGFVLMQKEIARYGSIAISAYGIGSKISNIYYIFVNCWGSGLTTFIGASLGADNPDRASKSYKSAMFIVFIVSLIFIPLGLLTSKTAIKLFIKGISEELTIKSLEYAYFSIFTAFAMGWMNCLNGVFNGSGNTLIAMILTGARIWFIRIPIIKLLNNLTTLGVTNIWIAMIISNLIVCIMGTLFYHFYNWKENSIKAL